MNVDLNHVTDAVENFFDHLQNFQIGGEFIAGTALRLRLGYDNEQHQAMDFNGTAGLAGFSGGVGIIIKNWRVDYGYSSWGVIGLFYGSLSTPCS